MGARRKVQDFLKSAQERFSSRLSDFIFLRDREKVRSPRSIQDCAIAEAEAGQDYPSIKRETSLERSVENFQHYYLLEKSWINAVISEHYQISVASKKRFGVTNILEKTFGAVHAIYKIKNNKPELDIIPEEYLKREYIILRTAEDIREAFHTVCKTELDRIDLVSDILKELNFGDEQFKAVLTNLEKMTPWRQNDAKPPSGEIYAQRENRTETAPAFIERVYGQAGWLTGKFTRADLRKIDYSAEMALRNWERHHGRSSVNLPTIKERNDRDIAAGDIQAKLRSNPYPRLRSALWRREHS
jgi:hypothetical protein